MFGKKNFLPAGSTPIIAVTAMPVEFYAGADPTVEFHQFKRAAKTRIGWPASVGGPRPVSAAGIFTNRVYLIFGAGILFLVFLIGIGWFYWHEAVRQNRERQEQPVAPAPSAIAPVVAPEPPAPVTATSTENNSASVPTPPSLAEITPAFPSLLLSDTADSDNDGATDAEEELFTTDPAVPDSDHDQYADGHEVYNLFNPAGKEPMKIIDSGLVKEYENPSFHFRVYYPASWALGTVDAEHRDVLFSTLSGEHIELRVFDKPESETFAEWFARMAVGEKYADLVEFPSVFKEHGWRRKDYLVYYFMDSQRVYLIAYHTVDSFAVNYRLTIKLLARSFHFSAGASQEPLSRPE